MSFGVAMDMGNINPYLTYANYQVSTNTGASGAKDAGVKESGIELVLPLRWVRIPLVLNTPQPLLQVLQVVKNSH